jgi:tetratricopeptide (TPR) repeat protein
MKRVLITICILFGVLWQGVKFETLAQEAIDTAVINRINEEAYINARRTPDKAIEMGHLTLRLSIEEAYQKGRADASLALGMAHLAKFNHADSAYIYNRKALELYEALDDIPGKGRACYALAYVFSFRGDLKESEKFSALSLEYFKQAGDKRGMINAYDALAYLAKQQNRLELARGYIQSAVETAHSASDTIPLANVLNSLGNLYKEMGLFKNAIDTYFEALNLWEKKNDSAGLSIAYGSIGLLYYFQQDYEKALEFNLKKLPIVRVKGELWEESKTYNNLANIFNSMDQHDSALYYNRRSLNLTRQMNYKSGMVAAYHNMARTMLLKSEVDSAFIYGSRAVELARLIYDPLLVNTLVTLGRIYTTQKNLSPALELAREAYTLAKQQKRPLLVSEAAQLLSDLYNVMGDNDLAYTFLKEYQQVKDSISNDAFHKKITRLDLQYEYDKRQKAAEFEQMQERLRQESRIERQGLYLKGLIILVILLVMISGLYIRHSRFRARYARMDFEQRLLRAQMNPHFIFNALCAVQDFILAGKPLQANTFLTKIARLMRNILEHTRQEYVPIDQEIDTLKLYLDLQQMRFKQEFEYHLSVDEAIDPENLAVPPMLAQPCVENSIEHGLLPRGKKGHLNISYQLKKDLLMLEVTDDGVGREQAAKAKVGNKKKKPLSTSLTEKRLAHFRKSLNEKAISYEIIDLYDGQEAKGTKVVMLLPYKMIYA